MEPIHTEYYKGFTIEIIPDEDAENPRTAWDNLGTMQCFHRRYTLGDKNLIRHEDYAGWDEMEDAIRKDLGAEIILPLYMYDHGGITISTSPFSCPWDSGRIGFIYVTREKLLKEYGNVRLTKDIIAKATKVLEGEVEVYDQFVQGDVYGYTIKDSEGEDGDSCWGYYGIEAAEEAAKEAIAYEIASKFKKNMVADLAKSGLEE